jgi:hypothetical protein
MARHWHLLGLDAPTVAALWAWFFARNLGRSLPLATMALLALATWVYYQADRLLDTRMQEKRQERHRFERRHRWQLLAAATAAGGVLIAGARVWIPGPELRAYAALGGLGLAYLLWTHWPGASPPAVAAKAAAVAAVFAPAAAVPAWAGAPGVPAALAAAVALFAGACWLNCFAIGHWEASRAAPPPPLVAPEVREKRGGGAAAGAPAPMNVRWAALALGVSAALAAPRPAALAVLLSATAFAALDALRPRLPALSLRIAADLALLTPMFWLWRR